MRDLVLARPLSSCVEVPAIFDFPDTGPYAAFGHSQLSIALPDTEGRIMRVDANLTRLLGIVSHPS
jgi:hypothetical protein